jgi:hypothetical protein
VTSDVNMNMVPVYAGQSVMGQWASTVPPTAIHSGQNQSGTTNMAPVYAGQSVVGPWASTVPSTVIPGAQNQSGTMNMAPVYVGQSVMGPWASTVPSTVIPGAQNQSGIEQHRIELQKRIGGVQQQITTLQEQIQTSMREPGLGAVQRVSDLQRQVAVAQGTLQQFFLQYSLLMAGNATPMVDHTQFPPAEPTLYATSLAATVPSIPPPTSPAVDNNSVPLPPFGDVPTISAGPQQQVLSRSLVPQPLPIRSAPSISAGPRQRSLSRTLREMEFEEDTEPMFGPLKQIKGPDMVISPQDMSIQLSPIRVAKTDGSGPVSADDVFSTMGNKPLSRQGAPGPSDDVAIESTLRPLGNNNEGPGLIVSTDDDFSKMGTKPRSKWHRPKTPKTPARSEQSKSASGMVLSMNSDALSRAGNSLKTPEPAKNVHKNMPVDVPIDVDLPVDVPIDVGPAQPPQEETLETGMTQLFPGLPPFKPTNMSLEDLDLEPGDLTVLPEELQQLLQEREPVVDKKGGRPSLQTLKTIDDELTEFDKRLVRLSKDTGVSVASIMKRWNTTKNRGGSLWNIYQRYFNDHKEDELARLGLDPSAEITSKIRANAYIAFRDAYPTTWPAVLEVWAQYTEVENPAKTLQHRSLQFRQVWRTLSHLVRTSQLFQFLF